MASGSPRSSSSASGSVDDVPLPSEAWVPSTQREEDIQDRVERGLIPEKEISGWKCFYGEEFPLEEKNQTVMFKSF